MDAGLIERIESGAERGAAALFAAAIGYASYGLLGLLLVQPVLGACAAGAGVLAFIPCSRGLTAASRRDAHFALPAFELREFDPFAPDPELLLTDADRLLPADELILTDADRLDGEAPLLLDDVLAEIGPDARVVRLFDRNAMPTPAELKSRIDNHFGHAVSVDPPADAAQALSDALAELRRSLR